MITTERALQVVFIDDDVCQLKALKIMLELSGDFKVDVFSSAAEALARIGSVKYDCVITDYSMPMMNGIELVKHVKKKLDVPVIMFSGYSDQGIIDSAYKAGTDEFIEKTADLEVFDLVGEAIRVLVTPRLLAAGRSAPTPVILASEAS